MRHIVFWQNVPSPHQASLIKSLAQKKQISVTVVTQEHLPAWRIESGWEEPDFGEANLIVAPDSQQLSYLYSSYADRSATHIFSGLRAYSLVWQAFKRVVYTDAQIGIYSETPDWFGIKGRLRLLRSFYDAMRYKNHIDFILAIGKQARLWFKQSGYSVDKIYPFAYFVSTAPELLQQSLSVQNQNNTVRLLFIGRHINVKGVDLLLESLSHLKDLNWQLDTVGDGAEILHLKDLARTYQLSERVKFHGALPNSVALSHLIQSDLLVLPSRGKDGWGVVVNESLMYGVPVICSSYCGASELLDGQERGVAFDIKELSAFRDTLAKWIQKGKRTPETTERLMEWGRCLQGNVAADYLLEIVRHSQKTTNMQRPIAPWLSEGG